MKSIRRGIAVLLAAMLIIPNIPAIAEEPVPTIDFSTLGTQEEASGVDNASENLLPEETVENASAEIPSDTISEPISTENDSIEEASTENDSIENVATEKATTETASTEAVTETEPSTETETELTEPTMETVVSAETEIEAEEEKTLLVSELEEVFFNTGNKVIRVSNEPVTEDMMLRGDGFRFDENDAFTIQIPEQNPFFPYEIQFTYKGETGSRWFMTPEDCIEVGGHRFYVAAMFDGQNVTRMNLNVAGTKVVVYPEPKNFTDNTIGNGNHLYSLLPLEERNFTADLTAFTPAELTMVSLTDVFTSGSTELKSTDKIMWVLQDFYNDLWDDYTISFPGDKLDLSFYTYYGNTTKWQMIVGNDDQLDQGNTRYTVTIKTKQSREWLIPTVYTQSEDGVRKNITLTSFGYDDAWGSDRSRRDLSITAAGSEMGDALEAYVGLAVNPAVFESVRYAGIKVFEGQFATAEEAQKGKDITSQIFSADMTQKDAGCLVNLFKETYITIVTYDAAGSVTGCLPVRLTLRQTSNSISHSSLDQRTETGSHSVGYFRYEGMTDGGVEMYTAELPKEYPVDGKYFIRMTYQKDGKEDNASVTAAFIGKYESIAEAKNAGAQEVKASLFNSDYAAGGYEADYSKGITFSIFVGEDHAEKQERYYRNYKTAEEVNVPTESQDPDLHDGNPVVYFTGLRDAAGNYIDSYSTKYDMDSYSEYEYLTMIVSPDTDLTKVAPEFSFQEDREGVNLYARGSNTPEVSGKSLHDFSASPMQYTAATQTMINGEDRSKAKNYWLQIIKAEEGTGKLYVNSLNDEDSKTRIENGVVYTKREVMMDSLQGMVHDILLINMGTGALSGLTTELASDILELDDYWRLKGQFDLAGYKTIDKDKDKPNGELPNMAKIRLHAKEGKVSDSENLGTLTIKSGGNSMMVFELTGSVGDPHITTQEIPKAVKYVPYGTMIQNSNKYDWNTLTYSVTGELPEGMQVLQSGELYGVPKQAGQFTFTVKMHNSSDRFRDDTKTFTLEVLDNSDINVDAATDEGYTVQQRIPDINTGNVQAQTFVSEGLFEGYKYVYLDGNKLNEGTDFTAESGSTRITINAETLGGLENGTHTIGVEFRENDELKRAAQNFKTNNKKDEGNKGEDNKDEEHQGDISNNDPSGTSNNQGSTNNSNTPVNNSTPGISQAPASNTSDLTSDNAAVDAANNSQTTTDAAGPVRYTVASGDTLWKIAEKFYGNGNYWRKIYEDNASVIRNPDRIFTGQMIVIYPLTEILNADFSAQLPQTDNTAAESTDINSYVVLPGDNLWKIARRLYGKGWQWRKIYDANRDILSNPGQLHTGQELVIPNN